MAEEVNILLKGGYSITLSTSLDKVKALVHSRNKVKKWEGYIQGFKHQTFIYLAKLPNLIQRRLEINQFSLEPIYLSGLLGSGHCYSKKPIEGSIVPTKKMNPKIPVNKISNFHCGDNMISPDDRVNEGTVVHRYQDTPRAEELEKINQELKNEKEKEEFKKEKQTLENDIKHLRNKNIELVELSENLREEFKNLEKDKRKLEEDKSKLEEDKSKLEEDKSKLEQESKILSEKFEQIQEKNKKLEEDSKILSEKYEKVRDDNIKGLRQKLIEYENIIIQKEKEIQALKDEYEREKIANNQIMDKMHKQMGQIIDSKEAEIKRLEFEVKRLREEKDLFEKRISEMRITQNTLIKDIEKRTNAESTLRLELRMSSVPDRLKMLEVWFHEDDKNKITKNILVTNCGNYIFYCKVVSGIDH